MTNNDYLFKMTIKEYVMDIIRNYYDAWGNTPGKINIAYAKEIAEDIQNDTNAKVTDEYTPATIKKIWNDKVTEFNNAGFSVLWRVHISLYNDSWSNHIRKGFSEPIHYNWTKSRGYKCILDISALDENDCVSFRITSDSMRHCYEEFSGQITDGIFENCIVASHDEVSTSIDELI